MEIKRGVRLLKSLGRKGNPVATVLVILMILIGISVVTYTEFIPKEESVNYGKVISEVQNVFDRVFFASNNVMMENGFSAFTNVWYCNKPLPPNATEIGESFSKYITNNLQEYFKESGIKGIEISVPDINPNMEDMESIKLNISNFLITIKEKDEIRTIDLSSNPSLFTNFAYYYKTLLKWMECNAGNITQKIDEINKNKPCQFDACCCGWFPMSDDLKNALVERYGITEAEIIPVIESSVGSLNNLFAGSDSCFEEGNPENQSVFCHVDYNESIINIDNYLKVNYSTKSCGDPQCTVNPISSKGTLMEWSDEQNTIPSQGCPENRTLLNVETGVSEDIGEEENPPIPSNSLSKYYMLALERRSAANLLIRCEVKKEGVEGIVNPETIKVRIRFNLKNYCELPPDDPPDTSTNACPGGGGGCPCELRCPTGCTDGKIWEMRDMRCDDLCNVIDPGECTQRECLPYSCICSNQTFPAECKNSYACKNCYDYVKECSNEYEQEYGCQVGIQWTCEGGEEEGGGSGGGGSGPGSGGGTGVGPGECTVDTQGEECEPLPEEEDSEIDSNCRVKYVCEGTSCIPGSTSPQTICDTCTICGQDGHCQTPAGYGQGCGNDGCVKIECDGSGIGQSACNVRTQKDNTCGSGDCQGTCNLDTGECDYPGGSCTLSSGGCTYDGTCSNGQCVGSPPAGEICCEGGWCTETCCPGYGCQPSCPENPN